MSGASSLTTDDVEGFFVKPLESRGCEAARALAAEGRREAEGRSFFLLMYDQIALATSVRDMVFFPHTAARSFDSRRGVFQ